MRCTELKANYRTKNATSSESKMETINKFKCLSWSIMHHHQKRESISYTTLRHTEGQEKKASWSG